MTLKYFGSQVKLFRGRAGLSRAELGERVGYAEATIASVEQGRRIPQQEFIERTDEALGADGVLRAGAPYLAQARYPSWFQDFALLEADAVSICSYESHVVPGLLQTEGYARSVFRAHCPTLDDDEVEARVAARLERHALLSRKPVPTLSFVVEESALRRPVGGRAVLREQVHRLREYRRLRHLTIQVMPLERETHGGLNGPFLLLETPERKCVAYVEGQSGSLLLSDRDEVSALAQRYGIIRSQALNPEDSAEFVDQLAGDL